MRAILESLASLPEIGETLKKLEAGRTPVLLTGLSPIHKAHVIAAIRRKTGRLPWQDGAFLLQEREAGAEDRLLETEIHSLEETQAFVKAAEQLLRANSRLFMMKRLTSGLLLTART